MTTNGNEERPLPDSWKWTTFEKLTDLSSGKAFKKSEYSEEGLRLLQIANVSFGEIIWDNLVYMPENYAELYPQLVLRSGDVLMALNRPIISGRLKIGQLVKKDAPAILYQRVGRFDVFDERLKPFLLYYCQSPIFIKTLENSLQGVDQPFINKSKLMKFPFPLVPFAEQERIVAEIEKQFTRLDQAVASLKRLQSNLARYKVSVLKAACDGRLVPQDPSDEPAPQLLVRILAERRAQWEVAKPGKKYKEPVGVETAVLPDLPEGWATVSLAEIVLSIQTGPFGSSLHKSDYVIGGIPVINPASIIDGKIKPIKRMAIDEDTRARLKGFVLKQGDVIMGRRGEMGRAAVVTEKEDGWLCGTGSLILRFAEPVSRQFMVYLFGSERVKAHLGNASVGTTMQNLNQKILLNMVVGLPSKAEQERIVAEVERRLSVVTATEQAITANLARAERLRQSILGRAFTGQLV